MLCFNDILAEIGKRIRKERKEAKKSQDDLCAWLQLEGHGIICRQTVGDWEGGKKLPDLEIMLSLCKLFECDLGYLLCEYDCKTREKTDIAAVTGLSESSIDKLVCFKEKKTSGNKEALDALNYMMSLDEFPVLLIKLEKYYRQCREDVKLQKPTPDLTAEEYGRKVTDLNNQMSESEYFIVKYFGQIIDEFKAAAEKGKELSISYPEKSDRKIRPDDPAEDLKGPSGS